jgi:hypothetical protein
LFEIAKWNLHVFSLLGFILAVDWAMFLDFGYKAVLTASNQKHRQAPSDNSHNCAPIRQIILGEA